MYLRKHFIIMHYCTVLHIFLIKNTLLPNIISILCSTQLFNNDEFVLRLKYATKISNSWEDCKYWNGCPITGIPTYIVIFSNQESIVTNMNYKSNEFADTLRKDLDVQNIGGNHTGQVQNNNKRKIQVGDNL